MRATVPGPFTSKEGQSVAARLLDGSLRPGVVPLLLEAFSKGDDSLSATEALALAEAACALMTHELSHLPARLRGWVATNHVSLDAAEAPVVDAAVERLSQALPAKLRPSAADLKRRLVWLQDPKFRPFEFLASPMRLLHPWGHFKALEKTWQEPPEAKIDHLLVGSSEDFLNDPGFVEIIPKALGAWRFAP